MYDVKVGDIIVRKSNLGRKHPYLILVESVDGVVAPVITVSDGLGCYVINPDTYYNYMKLTPMVKILYFSNVHVGSSA